MITRAIPKVLLLGLVLLGVLVFYAPIVKGAASPSAQLFQAYAFRHVLESDDFLMVARYDLPADGTLGDGDWDDYSRTDAYVELLDATAILVDRKHPSTIGPGLVGIYFDASDFAATSMVWGDGSVVQMVTSPTKFTPNAIHGPLALTWQSTSSVQATSTAYGNALLVLLSNMEQENAGTDAFEFEASELVSNGGITSAGAAYALAAFALSVVVSPDVFETSSTLIGNQFGGTFLSRMVVSPSGGQADIQVEDSSLFQTSMWTIVRDNNNTEQAQILSINSDLHILTMTANLTNGYSVSDLGVVVAAGLIVEIDQNTVSDTTRTALSGLGSSLGLSNGSGGLLAVIILIFAYVAVGIAVSGSTLISLASVPAIMAATVLAGWVPVPLLGAFMVLMALMSSMWFWRGAPN